MSDQKRLQRLMRAMARRQGIPVNAKIECIVSQLAGKQVSKREAYRWLQEIAGPSAQRPPKAKEEKRAHRTALAEARKLFEQSDGWREVRYRVLRQSGGCCALCGRSKRLHGVQLHVDHIKPKSLFPHLAFDQHNLQVLCEDCNMGKGNRDQTDWRPVAAAGSAA